MQELTALKRVQNCGTCSGNSVWSCLAWAVFTDYVPYNIQELTALKRGRTAEPVLGTVVLSGMGSFKFTACHDMQALTALKRGRTVEPVLGTVVLSGMGSFHYVP